MLGATERAALTDLVHRYAAGVDERQFDAVAELFTQTAELVLPEPPANLDPVHRHCGHAAIRAAIEAVAATIRTEHAIVGEVFDAGQQPDSARGRIACVAHHWSRHGDQLTDAVCAACFLPATGRMVPRSSCGRGMTWTPMTSPTELNTGPPELPGFTAIES